MAKQTTHIAVLLDRSGSMEDVREDARGSYNSYLAEQKKEKADNAIWSLTLFGGEDVVQLVDGVAVADAPPLGQEEYRPEGWTPLYDAMGMTMTALEGRMKKKDRALLVVITDGHENTSKEWSHAAIQSKVKSLTEQGNWTIVYLASTPDAVEIGQSLGVLAGNALAYSPGGEIPAFLRLDAATQNLRRSGALSSADFADSMTKGETPSVSS